MTNEKKMELLEDMMELDAGTLTPETTLSDLEEWDSIALLSFIAMMEEEFSKNVKGTELKKLQTVAEVMALMEQDA